MNTGKLPVYYNMERESDSSRIEVENRLFYASDRKNSNLKSQNCLLKNLRHIR